MSDIKVSENSQKIYKNKFLKSINFNNHVIYPSDGYYYFSNGITGYEDSYGDIHLSNGQVIIKK